MRTGSEASACASWTPSDAGAGSWSYREGAPIDAGSAPSGTYIVQLLGRAGAVLTGRIIVQR
ncbi:MAG: hypothetical protein R2810_01105 [Flavobacteriales bacterium]